jgi:hypothetical protein
MLEIFKKQTTKTISFQTAQEAYSYLFISLQEKGVDIEEASERAYKFSTEYAERMNIPVKTEIKEKGMKGILQDIKTITDFVKNNPTVWEIGKPIVVGAFSALTGVTLGAAVSDAKNNNETTHTPEQIVFDEDEIQAEAEIITENNE